MSNERSTQICNCCGKELGRHEEYVQIQQRWGYFSRKDGVIQKGNICEDCFERIAENFKVPLEEEKMTELI